MGHILSIVHPPENGAAYGKAVLAEVVTERQYAADIAGDTLIAQGVGTLTARAFANDLAHAKTGTEYTHAGFTFRIDSDDTPPNLCPCCGRLVRPEDALFAGERDTKCDGCYEFHRPDPMCQPAKTAHPQEGPTA